VWRRRAHRRRPDAGDADLRGLRQHGRLHPRGAVRRLHRPGRGSPGEGGLLQLERGHPDDRGRHEQGGPRDALPHRLRRQRLRAPGLASRRRPYVRPSTFSRTQRSRPCSSSSRLEYGPGW
jgi:hypothetical protein